MQPLISVILPNYNHSAFLEDRLVSIYNQTYKNFEVILLDDCSSDNSQKILSQYKDHSKTAHLICNSENSGSTFKQWDKGIKLAKGDSIWIAESDDYCDKTFLEKLIKCHIENPDIALSFCQSHRVNSEGVITGNWITHTSDFKENPFENNFLLEGNEFIEKYLIHKNVIPNVSAVLFNGDKIREIHPLVFKPYMKYYADWFYYVQLTSNSKIAFVSESLNYFRYHENSVISRAGNESGWGKIFEMELLGRREMLNFLKNKNPGNFKGIQKAARIGDTKLISLTAKGALSLGQYRLALLASKRRPSIFMIILKKILEKFILKIWNRSRLLFVRGKNI